MGRMLESFKRNDGPRPASSSQAGAKPHADDCVLEWALGDEQAPFIEVGGPGKLMEGSADVMAAQHPPQAKQPPHPPTEQAFVKSTLLVQLSEAKPLTVAFEPWTGLAVNSSGIAPEIIAFHQPGHAISKQYTELWNAMMASLPVKSSHVLLLTGLRPQIGATTVLLNLAAAGALQAKRRVAVVDAQTRRPSVAARLGFTPDLGLLDVVAGQAALEHTIVKTTIPGLHALPMSTTDSDVTLTREAAAWLVGRLRERFEVILIDGPTLQDAASLAVFAQVSDALFLVAPQRETTSLPRDVLQSIARLGGKLRGLLHTQFEM
jgi:Mrp family chromosome partitioning ATPase